MWLSRAEAKRHIASFVGSELKDLGYRLHGGTIVSWEQVGAESIMGAGVWMQFASWTDAYYLPRVVGLPQPQAVRVEIGIGPRGRDMYVDSRDRYGARYLTTLLPTQLRESWRDAARSAVLDSWEAWGAPTLTEDEVDGVAMCTAADDQFFPVATAEHVELWASLARATLLREATDQLARIRPMR
ncbi:hypothetical protein [Cellulomonas soli]